jgi:hypothetical protein
MKKIIVTFSFLILCASAFGQTKEELEGQIAPKKTEIGKLQGEVDALQAQIDALPGWRKGAFGTIGGNISEFNNWFNQSAPNVSSGSIGITGNAFANLKQEKFFWNNALNLNLSWVKFDNPDDALEDSGFQEAVDIFNISSLYGRNIAKNLAVSGLGEYRTTILNNFNNPGYLDLGVGLTWTPIPNFVAVVHPLNYNFVFAENDAVFQSSLGAKILVDYTRQIGAINFKSNLTAFASYESGDLSNWQWTNSFAYTLWKKIGVGFDFGLRNSNQETLANSLATFAAGDMTGAEPTFDNLDGQLQSFWTLGLSYAF